MRKELKNINAVAGDRTRVTRVTGGNTRHYTTTTLLYGITSFLYFFRVKLLDEISNTHPTLFLESSNNIG